MNLRRVWPVLAGFGGALILLQLLDLRGRDMERLQHRTDSLNVRLEQYQADSARRQTAIDSALAVATSAESIASFARRSAERSQLERDAAIATARRDTGAVPRERFEAVVAADSAVILDQQNQIGGLEHALAAMHVAFHEADSARANADSLLRDMTTNRDEWRREAKRANRIGLVTSFAWTLPSGQWQATIGIGKRIRLPGFLGGL